ncbi:MAG: hypothetical protein JXO22_09560 [Phycisphaerae bacterium]|nr:hypothetical protein [Phycisphaerae bacterium]
MLLASMMMLALWAGHMGRGGSEILVLIAVVAWIPVFVCLDRAAVIERGGLHCQGCGYDLHGQVTPRCPECGRELNAAERALLAGAALPPPARGLTRWGLTLVVVLVLLFTVTLGLVFYTRTPRVVGPRLAIGPAPAATRPTASVDTPEPVTSQPFDSP